MELHTFFKSPDWMVLPYPLRPNGFKAIRHFDGEFRKNKSYSKSYVTLLDKKENKI